MKLNPLREALKGRRVVMVDDSIVRGTTKSRIVNMIRDEGAKEVHVRISAPVYRWPCYYGVDTSNRSELIGARCTEEEIRQAIGADSLGYQTVQGLLKGLNIPRRKLCLACFTGRYPIPIPKDVKLSKLDLEKEEWAQETGDAAAGSPSPTETQE